MRLRDPAPPSFHRCAFVCVLAIALTGLSAQSVLAETGVTNVVSGTTKSISGDYIVGTNGAFNALVVTNAAVLKTTRGGIIGNSAIADSNQAWVTGAGSVWSNSSFLYVGYTGSFNQLTIADSGKMFNTVCYIGAAQGASNNAVLVSGAGSVWTNSASLYVGYYYYCKGNQLTITNGGKVYDTFGYVGYVSTASYIGNNSGADKNTVLVTGAGSVWNNSYNLYVGYGGAGNQLTIANGGKVYSSSGTIGADSSYASNNAVLVTGADSVWSNQYSLIVGYDNAGNQLTIANGGQVINSNGIIGRSAGAKSAVLVTGEGSIWTNGYILYVGYGGAGNQLTITNGGKVYYNDGYIGYDYSLRNLALVSGTNSLLLGECLTLGFSNASGNQLIVTNGGTVLAANILAGAYSGSTGNVITISGGNLLVTNLQANGALDIRRGGLTLNSGTVVADRLYATNFASSIININGGSLTAPVLLNAGQFTMTGGTLSVSGAFTNAVGGTFNLSGGNVLVPLQMNNRGTFIQSGGFFDPEVFTNSGSFALSGGTNMAEVFLNLLSGTVTQSGGEQDVNYATNFGSWTISGGVANLTNFINNGNATLTVSGGTLNGAVTIGDTGSFNRFTVTNGGMVIGNAGVIGNASLSSNNTGIVTGSGSLWTNSDFLFVGNSGSGNSLTISNGGQVLSVHGSIGFADTATSNSVTVVGTGSVWRNSDLTVGYLGFGNSLTVANGGQVFDGSGYIGCSDNFNASAGSSNTVTVTGSDSLWKNDGYLYIGYYGSGNSLIIANGGQVRNGPGRIGYAGSYDRGFGSGNSVIVTSAGSLWSNGGSLYVGTYACSSNSLTIASGGRVLNDDGYVGWTDPYADYTGFGNTVTVSDSGSIWSNNGSLYIGYRNPGNSLIIANGGHVFNGNGYIGQSSGWIIGRSSGNRVIVTDAGSIWQNNGELRIGEMAGDNSMTISNGGQVFSGNGNIGLTAGDNNNSALVTGLGSIWSNSSSLHVGNSGSSNSLTIANGGQVLNADSYIGYSGYGFNNSVTVTGSGSLWNNSGSLHVGNYSYTCSLMISNSGLVTASNVIIGTRTIAGHSLTVSGGWLYVTNATYDGTLDIRGGTFALDSGTVVVDHLYATNGANSIVNINGGSLTTPVLLNAGQFTMTGGTLNVSGAFTNAAGGTFNLSGGTNMAEVFLNLLSGTVTQSGGEHDVNYATNFGSWIISGGVANLTNFINDGNAALTVSGGRLNGSLTIGNTGSFNRFTVTNGSRVAGSVGVIGSAPLSTNNIGIVTGPGSLWTNDSDIYVGFTGSFNQLTITNAGKVINNNGYIGGNAAANNNSALIAGAGSVWSNNGFLMIGNGSSSNQLTVADGGTVFNSAYEPHIAGYIGYDSGANNNAVTVTGTGSVWNNNGELLLGYGGGSGNTLTITNGGTVFNTLSTIGWFPNSDSNAVTVTGAGSVWRNSSYVSLGASDGSDNNTLTIANSGQVFDTWGDVGSAGVSNAALVTGAGSVWNNSDGIVVGGFGSLNQLTISNGGQVYSLYNYIGESGSARSNTVLVTGAGSVWSNSDAINVGRGGSFNQLTITNGGAVFSGSTLIGYGNGDNAVLVTGAGTVLNNSGGLTVGNWGWNDTLTIANGGQVHSAYGDIGYFGNSNAVLVTDAGSAWNNSFGLHVGYYGSGNTLTITNSGTVTTSNAVIGYEASAGNSITVSDGNLYATNATSTGSINVNYGALTINSGTVVVNELYATNGVSSVVSFNGGTLNSGGSTINNGSILAVGNGTSAAALHLLGGTHSFANGLFINTNGWLTGTGAITGVITNAGTIAPGNAPGILNVSGDLTLLTNSLLLMELAGTNDGFYDRINVSGALAFDGTLTLSLLDGFTVSAGNRFDLFDFSSSSGSFSLTNLPGLDALMYWDTSALYTSGEIEADWMTGSLQVTLAPAAAASAGAQWQVDGGAWQNSGDTVSDLVIGDHTLAFKDVEGWIKPTNRVVQVDFGETTVMNLDYELTPLLLATVSRKTHGAAGDYDLNLNLDGVPSATIEPRLGGPNKVVFTFNKAVAAVDGILSANEFTLTNATYSSASIVGSNLTLNLASVVDQSQVTVVLKGIGDLAGNALSGTNAVKVSVLYGDVNQSGSVNVTDRLAVKSRLMQVLSSTNFLYDANASGSVNVTDRLVVKENLFHTVNMNGLNALFTTETESNGTVLSAVTLGEALGASSLTWSSDGDAEWAPAVASDGSSAACSGNTGDLNVSWVETTVTGPGTLSFEWAVSSEADADFLTFSVDGVDQPGRISGEAGWKAQTFTIAPGLHRLTWTYAKNGSKAVGSDAGWLRHIGFQPAP